MMVEAPARHPGDPPRRRECLVEVAMQEAAYATLTSQLHAYFEVSISGKSRSAIGTGSAQLATL